MAPNTYRVVRTWSGDLFDDDPARVVNGPPRIVDDDPSPPPDQTANHATPAISPRAEDGSSSVQNVESSSGTDHAPASPRIVVGGLAIRAEILEISLEGGPLWPISDHWEVADFDDPDIPFDEMVKLFGHSRAVDMLVTRSFRFGYCGVGDSRHRVRCAHQPNTPG